MQVTSKYFRLPTALAGVLTGVAILSVFPWLITNIFSDTYLPHGFCFLWNPRLLWLHVITDSVIWLAYVAISLTLARLAYVRRREMPFRGIFLAFGVFIIACGFTHFMDVVVLWKPLYWLAGDIKLITAIASLVTAIALPFYVPQIESLVHNAALSAENERRFLAATDSSLDAFYILESVRDPAGHLIDFRFAYLNAHSASRLKQNREELLGELLCDRYPANLSSGLFDKYKHVVETGELLDEEFAIDEPASDACWLHLQVVRVGDGVAITSSDVSQRKRAELALEESRAFAQSLIDTSPAAIITVGDDHIIRSMNAATQKMLWYSPEELVGKATPLIFYNSAEIKARAERLLTETGRLFQPGHDTILAGLSRGNEDNGEWTFIRKGGSQISVDVTVTALKGAGGAVAGYMGTFYDISEAKRREEYTAHIAQHDALTGLPTRTLLLDRLEMMIAQASRNGKPCALLMIDLNRFKQINDSFGHHTGDQLLVQVARRFKVALRAVDTVARMGGDEFVVLVSELEGRAGAQLVASKLLAALTPPFTLNGKNVVNIGASIGVCMYPENGSDATALLSHADIAMYYAKSFAGEQIKFFSHEIARTSLQKHDLEMALREALVNDEFDLHYQPQIDLGSGEIVGLEALLRWRSRRLGSVKPARFIPVAEDTGLIQPIGIWALNKACQDIRTLNEQAFKPLFISVNLSPRQLEQPDLVDIVAETLSRNRLAPESLEIEITEGVLIGDSPMAAKMLSALRSLGVRLAIDDFGTGFSNMASLLRFSVDRLKIDRSFIRDCSTDPNSGTVVRAIIALAHQLDRLVIAEGVETREQLELLKTAGCDMVQGYYFSKPVPLNAIAAFTTLKPSSGAVLNSYSELIGL